MVTLIKAYRNITTGKISLLNKATGLVVGHCDSVELIKHCSQPAVEAVVNESGRLRVVREKKKYVHAFMVGAISAVEGFKSYKGRGFTYSLDEPHHFATQMLEVIYNPYKMTFFTDKRTHMKLNDFRCEMSRITINNNGKMFAEIVI